VKVREIDQASILLPMEQCAALREAGAISTAAQVKG
jgi:hypothetical protein